MLRHQARLKECPQPGLAVAGICPGRYRTGSAPRSACVRHSRQIHSGPAKDKARSRFAPRRQRRADDRQETLEGDEDFERFVAERTLSAKKLPPVTEWLDAKEQAELEGVEQQQSVLVAAAVKRIEARRKQEKKRREKKKRKQQELKKKLIFLI